MEIFYQFKIINEFYWSSNDVYAFGDKKYKMYIQQIKWNSENIAQHTQKSYLAIFCELSNICYVHWAFGFCTLFPCWLYPFLPQKSPLLFPFS